MNTNENMECEHCSGEINKEKIIDEKWTLWKCDFCKREGLTRITEQNIDATKPMRYIRRNGTNRKKVKVYYGDIFGSEWSEIAKKIHNNNRGDIEGLYY